jgi:hypothetical protein
MIFPSLRSPLERADREADLKRPAHLTFLRMFQLRRPDQKTDAPAIKGPELDGSRAERAADPMVETLP